MMVSVLMAERLLFISYNLGALLASWSLSRCLVGRSTLSTRVLAVTLGYPIIVIPTSVLLGVFGQLTALAAVVTVAIEAVGLTILAKRYAGPQDEVQFSISRLEWVLIGVAIAAVICLAIPILQKQLLGASHFHWDDFSYHAPKAAHWLRAERLTLAPYSYHAYYPGNAELFSAWFMLSSRFDAFNSLASVYWLVLGFCSVVVSCRVLKVSPSASILAGALFLVTRPFIFNAGSFAAVDLAGSVLTGAAVAMALLAISSREPKSIVGPLIYCSCALGLAIGCKITFAPIAAVVLLGILFVHRRGGVSTLATFFGVFSLCALICGGFWYVRNWIVADNPFFPANLWLFEGPMDEKARTQTSLAHQLTLLDAKGLDHAFEKLLNWPRRIAWLILAGYGTTVLSICWPRVWRDPNGRRAIVVALLGLLALAVVAFGPFSGTVNDPRGAISVRLRFFLCFMLLGIPLVGYWVDQTKVVRPIAVIFGLLFICAANRGSLLAFAGFGVFLAAFAWILSKSFPRRMRRLYLPISVASCIVAVVALHYVMRQKQPLNDAWLSEQISAWKVLDSVPDGARLTWHSTFEDAKYYRAFGRELRLDPVRTMADGRVYLFLHEEWRTAKRTWWQPWRRKYQMSKYIENLRSQRIEYVFLMKRQKGEWPRQYPILRNSEEVLQVVDKPSYALFELQYPTKQGVHP